MRCPNCGKDFLESHLVNHQTKCVIASKQDGQVVPTQNEQAPAHSFIRLGTQSPILDIQTAALVKEAQQDMQAIFNDVGKKYIQELKLIAPDPVLISGDTGWGKSVLARAVAKELGQESSAINGHPGMDISMLVGMWRPNPVFLEGKPVGVTVIWQDGVLTDAIKNGKVFLFEEMTRSPEGMSRLFGLLDSGFRYWSLPEEGEIGMEVHSKFWMIGTSNPPKAGYTTQKLDKALLRRFKAVFEINSPIADEREIIHKILGYGTSADRVIAFVDRARMNAASNVNTGDLVALAHLISKGIAPVRAVALCLQPKYELGQGLVTLAESMF